MTTLWSVLMGVCLILCGARAGAQEAKEIRLDIQSQVLVDALNEWAQAAGFRLIGPAAATRHLPSPRLQGTFTPRAALNRLLAGTSLTYEFIDEGTVAIRERLPASLPAPSPAAGKQVDDRLLQLTAAQVDERRSSSGVAESENRAILSENGNESDSNKRQRGSLEEVIVTAQKREQKLIDVPISITALSGKQLEEAGINDMQNLSFAVPGLATQEIGPGRQNLAIRGLGTTKGSSSLVGIYLDEMPLTGPQDGFVSTYVALDVLDLERVEVLKGPQGTLFGEGSVGGTVRFMTRDPQLEYFGGDGSASMFSTSDGGWSEKVSLVLNVPVVENKFGLRLATSYADSAGWIDKVLTPSGQEVIQEDINDQQILDVRLKGLWQPTEALAVNGMVSVHRGDAGGTNIVNVGDRKDHNFIIEFAPFTPTDSTDDFELYNLTATYNFSGAQLLSSTSYADMSSVAMLYQRRPILDTVPNPSGGPRIQEVLHPDYALDSTSFSQEVRLSSTGSSALKWSMGAFYKDAKLIQNWQSGFAFYRFGLPVGATNQRQGEKATSTSESRTMFGDVTYQLTSRLEIGGGLRYFEDDREVYNAGVPNVAASFLEDTFDATTFRAYLSYAFSQGVRVYGSAATGFRSGGFNNSSANLSQGAPATYDPEDVISYELGTKMNLADGRLAVGAALFYSEWQDMQGPNFFTDSTGTPRQYTANVGEAEMKGVEWAFSWAATERLMLSLSGDVTDTEVTKIGLVANPPLFVGDPIDMVPEYSLSLGADYGFDWSATMPGYVRLQYNEQGKSTQTSRNLDTPIPQESTPVLHFLNAGLGADWSGWRFELFGRNLLDEDGALRAGSGLHAQARPRTFGVKLDKSF